MTRKIGHFKNPITGSIDWLEPETVSKIGTILSPTDVYKIGDDFKTLIEYDLKDCEETKSIDFFAIYEYENEKIVSDPIKMDEEKFATILADTVYYGNLLDNNEEIEKAKEKAQNNLNKKLLDNNIVLSNVLLNGIGFIKVNNDKICTIDKCKIEVNEEENRYEATLINCISIASIANLNNPYVEFIDDNGYKMTFSIPKVIVNDETTIKQLKVMIEGFKVNKTEEKIEYKKYDTVEESNEEDFILDRTCLLEKESNNDDIELDLDLFDF